MTNRAQRRAADKMAKSGHNRAGQTQPIAGAVASPPAENPTSEEIGLLVTLFNQCRYAEGEVIAQQQIKRFPRHGFFWKVLGLMIKSQGRIVESLEPMQKAATLLPNDAETHFNLGITLNDLGRLNEAEACYRRALEINPDYVEAQSNLGNTLKTLGRLNEAEACYRRTLELKPDYALPHSNLGVILRELGRLNEAEASFRRALEINPDYAEAHYNLGNTLLDIDRLNEAEACYRRALEIDPDYVEAHYNLGKTFNALRHQNDAEASYRRALEIKPDYVEAYYNLGITLMDLGRQNEAEACYRLALQLKPDYVEVHNNLGITVMDLGRMNEAEACYRQSLEINPDYVEAYCNLGNTLKDLGRPNEAEACFRRALEIKPDYAMAHCNLLFTLNYAACHPTSYLLEEARSWETGCISEADRSAARTRRFSRPTVTGRRLRVGYVSADFRQHAVSYFVEQVFTHHDAARVEVFAYSNSAKRDAVTERIEALVEHWVPVMGLSDQKLRDCIEADQIDVLIDLSGHTAQNRLGVFALRAAPVQAHWLGYFASTGLTEMDYWIGDLILTPPETDSHFSETVWRLPRTWVSYEGKDDAPDSQWQPAPDGTLWLGSFNNLAKLTPASFALWAQVLHKLPEAKLLIKTKGLAEERNHQRILDTMASHGIGNERIELQDSRITVDWASHMAYYDRLDISLDPVGGVGGGTTTCDALWMGVPVVSLAGDRMASRMTASMLNAIGRSEWLAGSEEEYVTKVAELAHDVAGRDVMRVSQRDCMASSQLCNAKDLASKLEEAYEAMFERWEDNKNQIVGLKNVVFIGDSITRGTCFSDIEVYTSFASRAAKELPVACPQYIWNVYNEGVDGSCTRNWVNWIDNKVIVHNPTDVVICLGVNDSADDSFPYHVAPDDFHSNLLFIINKIRTSPETLRVDSQAVNIILINIPLINSSKLTWGRTDPYREQYRSIIQAVAKEKDCKVVDIFSEVESCQHNFDTYYFSGDGIHISDLSHTLIYNKLLPLLATTIECVL